MMRGGTLSILGRGSKVKVNFNTLLIKPCGHDTDYSLSVRPSCSALWAQYRLQFLPNHPFYFGSRGSKVKVNFDTLSLKPCGHDTDYGFARSLSNFTCKLFMVRGGTLWILGHGVKFQGQLYPLARGCHALRCLVVKCGTFQIHL